MQKRGCQRFTRNRDREMTSNYTPFSQSSISVVCCHSSVHLPTLPVLTSKRKSIVRHSHLTPPHRTSLSSPTVYTLFSSCFPDLCPFASSLRAGTCQCTWVDRASCTAAPPTRIESTKGASSFCAVLYATSSPALLLFSFVGGHYWTGWVLKRKI